MSWFNVKNKDNDTGEVYIYGEITNDKWFEEDVTPAWFKEEIAKLKNMKRINLYVNSGGGGVYAGMAIYNMLKRQNAYITAFNDGIAASTASFILMAANKIIMPKSSMIMIHNPISITIGDSNDMRKEADTLDRVRDNIVSIYKERKVKPSEDKLKEMMKEETWMNGDEAFKNGFVDELSNSDVKASIYPNEQSNILNVNGIEININKYKQFPTNFLKSAVTSGGFEARNKLNSKLLKVKLEVSNEVR